VSDPARKIDPDLPPEIASAMEAAGHSPKLATLMNIIVEFQRLKEATAKASDAEPTADKQPLMKLLPVGVEYERARRAAGRGDLEAEKPSGRWLSTERAVARWLAMIGYGN
jgi:hypothetical protein